MVAMIDDPSGCLMRWRLRLAEYDLEVRSKRGKEKNQAYALSKLHTDSETVPDDDDDSTTISVDEDNDADDVFVDLLREKDNVDDFAEP